MVSYVHEFYTKIYRLADFKIVVIYNFLYASIIKHTKMTREVDKTHWSSQHNHKPVMKTIPLIHFALLFVFCQT